MCPYVPAVPGRFENEAGRAASPPRPVRRCRPETRGSHPPWCFSAGTGGRASARFERAAPGQLDQGPGPEQVMQEGFGRQPGPHAFQQLDHSGRRRSSAPRSAAEISLAGRPGLDDATGAGRLARCCNWAGQVFPQEALDQAGGGRCASLTRRLAALTISAKPLASGSAPASVGDLDRPAQRTLPLVDGPADETGPSGGRPSAELPLRASAATGRAPLYSPLAVDSSAPVSPSDGSTWSM